MQRAARRWLQKDDGVMDARPHEEPVNVAPLKHGADHPCRLAQRARAVAIDHFWSGTVDVGVGDQHGLAPGLPPNITVILQQYG